MTRTPQMPSVRAAMPVFGAVNTTTPFTTNCVASAPTRTSRALTDLPLALGVATAEWEARWKSILLMADRQTTGGYAKIATVISADLSIAGQLAPGDWIAFEICERQEAIAALIALEQTLMHG